MTGFTGRIARALVLSLVALLVFSLPMAAPAVADQCAPPGLDSASTVPTNLASAAAGPGEDKYTTPTVAPLDTVKVDTLGLGTPGVLTVGTLSDAPPSICIDSAGQFTGFDNELLRAMAEKIGLRVNFVGTEFSGLLAQVASRRFDVGSSSITTTDARRRTVGFTNGYDFGYMAVVAKEDDKVKGFKDLTKDTRIAVVQGTVQDDYVTNTLQIEPVRFEDYNTAYANLKNGLVDAWVAPSQQATGQVKEGDGTVIAESIVNTQNFTAYAVNSDNQALIDALNSGLDAVIADGTWSKLTKEWYPDRETPATWSPGSKAVIVPKS